MTVIAQQMIATQTILEQPKKKQKRDGIRELSFILERGKEEMTDIKVHLERDNEVRFVYCSFTSDLNEIEDEFYKNDFEERERQINMIIACARTSYEEVKSKLRITALSKKIAEMQEEIDRLKRGETK